MSHIIHYFCETFRDIITEIFYKHGRKKNAFFLAFGHTFMITEPKVEKKIFFKIFFSVVRGGCTKFFRKKNFKIFFSNLTSKNKMYAKNLNKNGIFFNVGQKTWP